VCSEGWPIVGLAPGARSSGHATIGRRCPKRSTQIAIRSGVIRGLRRLYVRSGVRERLPQGLKTRARRAWMRSARAIGYPIHSPLLTAPGRPRRRSRLRLTHALVACDLNGGYVESWPLVRRAWLELAGVEPILVLVATQEDMPAELLVDERVVRFSPVDGVHTALQAQCIRLLYPALLEVDGAVLISDMELVPLDPRYFHGPIAALDDGFFVAYRDVLLPRGEVAMAYNLARPRTWAEAFSVADLDGVRSRLSEWAAGTDYAGIRGGAGWDTDQRVLYRTLLEWRERTGRFWLLDDEFTGFRRLDRKDVAATGTLTPEHERNLRARVYTDFHSPHPHSRFRELNERVLDLALEPSSGRGRDRSRSVGRSAAEETAPPRFDEAEAARLGAAPTHPCFITGNGFAARCRYVLNYGELTVNEAGEDGWWFCKADFLESFFADLAPDSPFVLVSHNSDRPIGSRFASHLERENLIAWLAANASFEHPKLLPIPLGIANPAWPHGDSAALEAVRRSPPAKSRLFDVSFDVETNAQERRRCLAETGLQAEARSGFAEYLERLASAYFCVAPRGNGIDTHRVWEALYVGTVPVVTGSVVASQHRHLPMVALGDWSEFSSVDFGPELYRRLWSGWQPDELCLDPYLERVSKVVARLRD
jgi:hypothetical protein